MFFKIAGIGIPGSAIHLLCQLRLLWLFPHPQSKVEYVFKNSSHVLSFLFTENTARVYSGIPCFMLAAGGSCELGRVHPSVEGYRINTDRTRHRGKAPHPAWGFVYDCMGPLNFLSSITHNPPGLHGSLT